MHKVVISDTSILIIFQKIGQLNLLYRLYGEIFTTPEVTKEYGETLPPWIKIQSVADQKFQKLLETQLDLGESSALALASEFDDVLVLIDDLKARKVAISLNYKVTGSLGIIHKAKQMSLIDSIKPIIDKLLLTNFRISDKIINEILILNNEI